MKPKSILDNKLLEKSFNEIMKIKNKYRYWKIVPDWVFNNLYVNSNHNIQSITGFIALLEITGVIQTNIQDIFKGEDVEFLSHKLMLSTLLYNMGSGFYKEIPEDENNWSMAVLSFESGVYIDEFAFNCHAGRILCNVYMSENDRIKQSYASFKESAQKFNDLKPFNLEQGQEGIQMVEEIYENHILNG